MSDRDLPELPSDEELGITEEDRKAWEAEERGEAAAGDPEGTARPDREPPPGTPPAGAPPPATGKRVAAAPSPIYPWRGPLTLAVILALAFLFRMDAALPTTAPLGAPDTVFSSGRAMLDMVAIAREAHPTGSPEHARVRTYLLDRLEALGLEPEVQTAVSLRRRGELVRAVTVRNVLARIPGTGSTGAVLVTAHYDSRGLARGAGDDGSGTVAILETLRALRSLPPLPNDLLVLLTDAEELGLMGARAFVAEHPWMEDVAVVLSVEMRGGGGPSIMFETGVENGWIVEALKEGDPRPFANSLSFEVYRRLPNDTDFTPFREAGIQGLNFAAIGNPHVYHQRYDEPERYDERTLQHHGLHLLGMVRELGARDLSDVDGPDRVFFTLPYVGLVTYPPAVGWVLAGGLLLVAVLVFGLVRRDGGGVLGAGVGLALALVAVAGSAGGAWLLFSEVQAYHPELGALHGSAFHVEGWYVAAIAAVALALTVLLLHLVRGRFDPGALALGASVPLVLAGVGLAFVAPLGAMNLQWPALFALLGAAVVAGVGPVRRPGLVRWLGLLVLAPGILAFMVPLTELLWISLSLEAAAVIGGLMGLTVVALLPLLDTLREPGGWWVPILGTVLAAAFVGAGLLHARPSADRPAPSTLLWAMDRSTDSASWATAADGGEGWAARRAGVSWDTASAGALEAYLLGSRSYVMAAAPVVDVPGPEVVVEARTGAGRVEGAGVVPEPPGELERRTLTLSLRSAVGAEMIALRIPAAGDVFLERVGGRPVPDQDPEDRSGARRARIVEHWGVPDPALTVELSVGPGVDTLALEVVEHHLRPGELVGPSHFLRPPDLAPNIVTGSDRAVLRSVVRILPGTGTVLPEAGSMLPATDSVAPPPDTTAPPAVPPSDTASPPDTMLPPDTASPPDSARFHASAANASVGSIRSARRRGTTHASRQVAVMIAR